MSSLREQVDGLIDAPPLRVATAIRGQPVTLYVRDLSALELIELQSRLENAPRDLVLSLRIAASLCDESGALLYSLDETDVVAKLGQRCLTDCINAINEVAGGVSVDSEKKD